MTVYLTISYAGRDRAGWVRQYRDGRIEKMSRKDEQGNEWRYDRAEGGWTLSLFDPQGNLLAGPSPVAPPSVCPPDEPSPA